MREEYLSIIADVRDHLGIKEGIVIYAYDVTTEERTLLTRLGERLNEKIAPTKVVSQEEEIGSPKLLVTTKRLESDLNTLLLENIGQYIVVPERRRTLWDSIKRAYS